MPNVAIGTVAQAGTLWGAGWPAPFAFAAPTLGQVVAAQRGGVNQWMLATGLLPTDQVWMDTANPAATSTQWWPASSVKFAPAPTPAPPVPPAPAASTLTIHWGAPAANTDGSTPLTALSGYTILQGPTPGSMVKVATIPQTQFSYTTPPLADGTYYLAVLANAVDTMISPQSNVVVGTVSAKKVTIPGAPTTITLSCTLTGSTV